MGVQLQVSDFELFVTWNWIPVIGYPRDFHVNSHEGIFFSESTWLNVWIITMMRCLSHRNVMSVKVYKKKIEKF